MQYLYSNILHLKGGELEPHSEMLQKVVRTSTFPRLLQGMPAGLLVTLFVRWIRGHLGPQGGSQVIPSYSLICWISETNDSRPHICHDKKTYRIAGGKVKEHSAYLLWLIPSVWQEVHYWLGWSSKKGESARDNMTWTWTCLANCGLVDVHVKHQSRNSTFESRKIKDFILCKLLLATRLSRTYHLPRIYEICWICTNQFGTS